VAQLRQHKERFGRLGAQVVLVGLGTTGETADFKKNFDVPFPMIADPQKHLFKAFQLKQGSTTDLLSANMLVKGMSAMFKGHRMGVPKGDVRQLPGVFIIDTGGEIRFQHYAKGPADHPDAEDLLQALQREVK
jgi:peroxiredoxin